MRGEPSDASGGAPAHRLYEMHDSMPAKVSLWLRCASCPPSKV